ncbi:MAG: hypothetical protein A3J72_08815 [Nitrospirae bacterium RIFCSPHIGHO2_02_FULL_40_19]|nr:MAG: hypothetical protein A3J72_08815 [Nitrospirae bacterium RIFCSPHIGHO2_02_FULL_40_19]
MLNYQHPKIFADFLTLYKKYYNAHKNLPKIFRVTIGTEIMREMSDSMKLITLANFKKKTKEDYEEGLRNIKNLRGKIEIIKAYFLIAWEMKFVSHNLYADILERTEEISKQAAAWGAWFEKQNKE